MTDKKITIKVASKILNVSTKTIHRYLTKGHLTRIKEGTRTVLLLSEVRALQAHPILGQGRPSLDKNGTDVMGHIKDIVTLSRERYEQILIELGELRKQSRFSMEFDEMLRGKEAAFQRLELEVEQLRERVCALEMKKSNEFSSGKDNQQEPEGKVDKITPRGKKPWWQV